MHRVTELAYPYEALEPYIDRETMRLHHREHHRGDADRLNAALEPFSELRSWSIVKLLSEIDQAPEEVRAVVRNHGGGHANHNLYFTVIGPDGGGQPTGRLAELIESTFGEFGRFHQQFTDAALGIFGSGWAWLTLDRDGALQLETTPGQDSPLMYGRQPILGVDMWEHAYYLQYQDRRDEYLQAWWHVVDWHTVANIVDTVSSVKAP